MQQDGRLYETMRVGVALKRPYSQYPRLTYEGFKRQQVKPLRVNLALMTCLNSIHR